MTYVAQFYHRFTAPDSGEGETKKMVFYFSDQAMILLSRHHLNTRAVKKNLQDELTTQEKGKEEEQISWNGKEGDH